MTTTDTSKKAPAEAEDATGTEGETESAAVMTTPLILDLGKRGKKTVRRLRKGRGPAMAEVRDVLEQVQAELAEEAGDKVLLPVIVLYGRKRRRGRGPWR
jgi:hypothetical protein